MRRLDWVRAFVVLLGLSLGLFVGYRSTASPPPSGAARSIAEVAQGRLARIQQAGGARPDAERLRDWMRRSRLPAGVGEISAEWYQKAALEMARLPRYSTRLGREVAAESTGGDAAWEELGPADIGGRVRSLLVDPTNPKILYAGGVSGGMWKSENRGASWRSISNEGPPYGLSNLAISALAFDPRDSRILYAGTGEGLVSGPQGVGIYKSGDAGAHWVQLNRPIIDGHLAPTHVNDLVVSSNGERLYAATTEGLLRVTASGSLWQRVYDPRTPDGCHDVALRPGGSSGPDADDFVVASCGSKVQTVVVRNTRAQRSDSLWVKILDEPGMGRTSLAFSPSKRNVLYAVSAHVNQPGLPGQPSSGLHAVFRSDRAGARGSFEARVRWNQADTGGPLARFLLSYALIATGSSCGAFDPSEEVNLGQGWYANTVAVDPTNPDRLFVGGIDLYRSDDGGRSWGIASHWWPHAGNGYPTSPAYVHADQHAVVFDPGFDGNRNRRLYAANDAGVFMTTDALAPTGTSRAAGCDPALTKVKWLARSRGLAVTQFYTGSVFDGGERFWGGTQDNGTLLGRRTDDGRSWRQVLGSDGWFSVVANRAGGDVLLGQDVVNGVLRSTDGGVTFAARGDEIRAAKEPGLGLGTPLAVDPNDPQRVWLGTWERPWRSLDAGFSWTPASRRGTGPVLQYPNFNAIAVSPLDSNRVLAVGWAGEVWATDRGTTADGTTDWTKTRPRIGNASAVAWHPQAPATAYVTFSTFGGDHLWRTDDAGVTWSPVGNGPVGRLPDVPLLSVAVDPIGGRLYVGTDLGILVSLDSGATWAVEASGFEPVITPSLVVHRAADGAWYLVAFTHGRGAWRVKLG